MIPEKWKFSISADILCSTASIWNLSIVGLDRYWAITAPTAYMSKRNKRTAALLILAVWLSSALISLAPLFGWRQVKQYLFRALRFELLTLKMLQYYVSKKIADLLVLLSISKT